MSTLGERISEGLALRDMSVPELARASGIPYSTLKGIVDGHQQGSTKLQAIADALRVRAAWLATGKGKMESLEPDYEDITGFAQAVGLGSESEIAEYEETHKLKFRADSLGRKKLRALCLLSSLAGVGYMGITFKYAKSAPQEAAGMAIAMALAVVPYVLARAVQELRR